MRDAIGGVFNLVIIVVFMVIVSGYLAFNVSYTKAFRVKNKIISTYEQYEGNCTYSNSKCRQVIIDYMNSIGYKIEGKNFQIADYDCRDGYCVKKVSVKPDSSSSLNEYKDQYYFKVQTQISINLPIINNILGGLTTFRVSGDTKTFRVRAK